MPETPPENPAARLPEREPDPAPMQIAHPPPAPPGAVWAHANSTPEDLIKYRRLVMAVTEIGSCQADLGRVIAQGITTENEATRGNIALGLERAAAYVRGQSFQRAPDNPVD